MRMGNRMMKVILAVVISGLLLGYVFPVGMTEINEDPTYEVTLEEGTEEQIQEGLNATVTSSSDGSNATIELEDTQTGTTESQTIDVGERGKYNSLEGGFVNVSVDSVDSDTTEAEVTVEQGFAWDDNSQRIFQIFGLFLVIVPLIVLAKQAMEA